MVNEHSTGDITLQSWGLTDVGMKRRLNEDVFLIDVDAGIYLVADGMGGHAAGEVASRLAADEIDRVVSSRVRLIAETWPDHWDPDYSTSANLLTDAVKEAHRHVTDAVARDPDLKGMGTTVVVACHQVDSGHLVICHVGDSNGKGDARGACLSHTALSNGEWDRLDPIWWWVNRFPGLELLRETVLYGVVGDKAMVLGPQAGHRLADGA